MSDGAENQNFEDLLASQSSLILSAQTEQFEEKLAAIAQDALTWFGLDRVALVPNAANAYKEHRIIGFSRPGIVCIYDEDKDINFSPYLKYMSTRELAVVFNAKQLKTSDTEVVRDLYGQGVRWHCILPLNLFGKRWGGITAASFEENPPEFPAHQLVRLKLLGELWASYWQFAILTRNLDPHAETVLPAEDDALAKLSLRQREVISLLASGLSAKEVANKLFLSSRTVESHKYRIMDILGLESHSQLVQFAASNGLIAG